MPHVGKQPVKTKIIVNYCWTWTCNAVLAHLVSLWTKDLRKQRCSEAGKCLIQSRLLLFITYTNKLKGEVTLD